MARSGQRAIPGRLKALLMFALFSTNAFSAQIMYEPALSMGSLNSLGSNPQARLLVDSNGTLYGTTYQGGSAGRGTIFAIDPDGSDFKLLHQFRSVGNDGARPYADLGFGPDGAIYGTTEKGGNNDGGTIFRIRSDGGGYQVLFRFAAAGGYWPRGHLLHGPDGYFYSTTQFGGAGNRGAVYKIRPDGTGFAVLYAFGGQVGDGGDPDTGLTLGRNGLLYGVTSTGGTFGSGTVFRLARDGSAFTYLHHFDGTNGWEPDGQLLQLSDGLLYGTTQYTGVNERPIIYRINEDGSRFEIIKRLSAPDGDPQIFLAGLTLGNDGALYGSLVTGVIKIRPDGSDFQVLHRFASPSVGDGLAAYGLVNGIDGALFGVTGMGGTNRQGVIFRINTTGSGYSILHHFLHSPHGPALPRRSLLKTDSGSFYGTSEAGGSTNAGAVFSLRANGDDAQLLFSFGEGTNTARLPSVLCEANDGFLYGTTMQGGNFNAGTIFRIGKNGSNFSVLRHLGATGDPRAPRSGLILDTAGWLYGTSFGGGTAGGGTVYKLHKITAEFALLHSLSAADGYQPMCELVRSADGNLYGTAGLGGSQNMGVIFRIRSDGSNYTVLHSFSGGAQGQNPQSGLMIGSDGRLYGTTARQLGSFAGTVYALNLDGSGFQTLRSFPNAGIEPKQPRHVLVEGPDGALYGTTTGGGAYNKGALFRIRKNGSGFEVLQEFDGSSGDGEIPSAGLTPVGDGSFLGVTEAGGATGTGIVFRFDPALVPVRISLSATAADLRWPASSTLDELEVSNLSGFDWQRSQAEVSNDGDELHTSIPRQAMGQLFRVRRIWK
jgi:uncharacterized repeat protein (TIGR03803 family)